MTNLYDDILHLPHHTSATRPRMSAHDRAAQFSPFAALTGFDDAITETARLTDTQVELDEYSQTDQNDRLDLIRRQLQERQPEDRLEVAITYFQPDPQKPGGIYKTITGRVKKVNEYERTLVMRDATKIPIDAILEIDGVPDTLTPSAEMSQRGGMT